MRVYLIRAMSGRNKSVVVKEAKKDRNTLKAFGIEPLCPVISEGVENKNETLLATKEQMDNYWFRDKSMIREANVVFDMTPSMKSFGSEHEVGYARYCLWKPVVRVFPKGKLPAPGNVSFYEDDIVVDSLTDACVKTKRLWGSRTKRIKWRLKMLSRSLFKWAFHQLREFAL